MKQLKLTFLVHQPQQRQENHETHINNFADQVIDFLKTNFSLFF